MKCTVAALCLLGVGALDLPAEGWPQFRGPHGLAVAHGKGYPLDFAPGTNEAWTVTAPAGHSSPCVWKDTLVITAYEEQEKQLQVLAYDTATGQQRWSRNLTPGRVELGARWSHPATSTPVMDARHVYVYFGSFGLVCYDHAGREQWRYPLETQVTQHGASASPIAAGELLILPRDGDKGSRLLAFHKETGALAWTAERPGFRRGFSTPLAWPLENPRQVILPGTLRLMAYGLSDGTEQWSVRGLPNEMVSSPAAGEGLVFVAGWTYGSGVRHVPGFETLASFDADGDGSLSQVEAEKAGGPARQHFQYIDADKNGEIDRDEWETIAAIFNQSENALLAVRPGGRGDVTESHVVWSKHRGLPYVPSPVCYDGRVYLVKNGGLASCYDAATGEEHYREERLGALGDYYASPVAAEGRIYAASQHGVVVVYRADPPLEVLRRHEFPEAILATPAFSAGTIYVRTLNRLHAFRESTE